MKRRDLLAVARGESPADLLIKGGEVVSVFSGEVFRANVAVAGGLIVGIGEYAQARRVIDAGGELVLPGFIDPHVHVESSRLWVDEFARALLRRGVTAAVADPHEIANVLGEAGVRMMLRAARALPFRLFLTAPSCVPASPFEGCRRIGPGELRRLLASPGVSGLGELMDFPAVIQGTPQTEAKLRAARGRHVDGHAPGLLPPKLDAYLLAGATTDHESTAPVEAREKLRRGMWLFVREGSASRDLEAVLPAVLGAGEARAALCTDDIEAEDLLERGGVDHAVWRCLDLGLDLPRAARLGSLNAALAHGLSGLGALAPGYQADLQILREPRSAPRFVLVGGEVVVEEGETPSFPRVSPPARARATVRTGPITPARFRAPAPDPQARRALVRVIQVAPDTILTKAEVAEVPVEGGALLPDPHEDLAKVAVLERHGGRPATAIGFVRGFGLGRGALASTVAHDAHELVVVGVDERDMATAASHVSRLGGGLAAVAGGRVLADLPLPVAGLMSSDPAEVVAERSRRLEEAARELGTSLPRPFSTLSFLCLSVIPELRITVKGLVDVGAFRLVPLAV